MKVLTKVYDERFKALFDPDEKLIQIASGLVAGEGPVWHQRDKCLYFNDIAASKTYKYSAAEGLANAFNNGVMANGMFVDKEGRLLMCEQVTNSITTRNTDGSRRRMLADYYGGKELLGPNDIVQRSDGLIFFTDSTYGRMDKIFGMYRPLSTDVRALYCYSPSERYISMVAPDFENPNGLCFSPDESILYVNDTPKRTIYAFHMKPDGTPASKRLFCTCGGKPDGMRVDTQGNIVVAELDDGLEWYAPDGTLLGVIDVKDKVLNIAWGDEDYKTLYLIARNHAYKIRTLVAGHQCC